MGNYLDVMVIFTYMTTQVSTEVMEQRDPQSKLRGSNHTAYYIHLKCILRSRERDG